MYFPSLAGGFSESYAGNPTTQSSEKLQQKTINKTTNPSNQIKTKNVKNKNTVQINKHSNYTKEMKDFTRKCSKSIKTRRGKRCSVGRRHVKSQITGHIKMFFTNGAGVKYGKLKSLHSEVLNTKAEY